MHGLSVMARVRRKKWHIIGNKMVTTCCGVSTKKALLTDGESLRKLNRDNVSCKKCLKEYLKWEG